MEKSYLISGAIFILLSIILGAFGSHALRPILPESSFYGYTVATHYLGFQGLGLLVIGLLQVHYEIPALVYQGLFWGTLVFSGSILLLTLGKLMEWNLGFLGPITPIGGLMLILSWGLLSRFFIRLP
jgi:uncharacterized membrane protein YgdD (TMEM256/DUF423 family)